MGVVVMGFVMMMRFHIRIPQLGFFVGRPQRQSRQPWSATRRSVSRTPLAVGQRLVVVLLIERDLAHQIEDLVLAASAGVFPERRGHRLLFGAVLSGPAGLLDEGVIEGKIGRHVNTSVISLHKMLHIGPAPAIPTGLTDEPGDGDGFREARHAAYTVRRSRGMSALT